jgi:hypothetical protein
VNLRIADSNCARLASYSAIAYVDVVIACGQINACASAQSDVTAADGVVIKRKGAHSRVVHAGRVKHHGGCSISGVSCSRGVQDERGSASGRVRIRGVEQKGPSTNRGIEAAGGVAEEREPTSSCVGRASGEVLKRVLPFRRRKAGIASVRSRTDRLRQRRERAKHKAAQSKECDFGDDALSIHNKLHTDRDRLLFQRIEKKSFLCSFGVRRYRAALEVPPSQSKGLEI